MLLLHMMMATFWNSCRLPCGERPRSTFTTAGSFLVLATNTFSAARMHFSFFFQRSRGVFQSKSGGGIGKIKLFSEFFHNDQQQAMRGFESTTMLKENKSTTSRSMNMR